MLPLYWSVSLRMSLLVSFQRVALLVAIFQRVFIFLKAFSNNWVLGLLNIVAIEPRDRYPRQFAVGDNKTLLTTLSYGLEKKRNLNVENAQTESSLLKLS